MIKSFLLIILITFPILLCKSTEVYVCSWDSPSDYSCKMISERTVGSRQSEEDEFVEEYSAEADTVKTEKKNYVEEKPELPWYMY